MTSSAPVHSMSRLTVIVTVGVAILSSVTLVRSDETPADHTLDHVETGHRDHDDGRRDADLGVTLRSAAGEHVLEIAVSAIGPLVEPPRGYQWPRGSNVITAEELDTLVSGRRTIEGESLAVADGVRRPGALRVLRRGALPRRRLLDDGTLELQSETRRRFPIEVVLETPLRGDGRHHVTWRVDGEPRLRVTVSIDGDIGSIEGVEPLAPASLVPGSARLLAATAGDPASAGRLSTTDATSEESPVVAEKVLAPVDEAEWSRRDLEGRWALMTRRLEVDPARATEWVSFLAARGELELLEWIAIYRPRAFHNMKVGATLARLGAPQWVRVAVWNLQSVDGHTIASAEARLLLERPGEVLAWFREHPSAATGKATVVLQRLERLGVARASAAHLLPPLDRHEVLRHLEPPGALEDFGDRVRAEPGTVYTHQVARAIDGAVAMKRPPPDVVEQLGRLGEHAHVGVAQRAYLAHANLPSELIPRARLLAAARDPSRPDRVREAALLGVSYADHPEVYLALHHVAMAPGHPAWRAAVSRLGDVGDEFTLTQTRLEDLDQASHAFLERELHRIRERLAATGKDHAAVLVRQVARRLLRAAWADLTGDVLEVTLVPWTLESIRAHANDPAVRKKLRDLLSWQPVIDGKPSPDELRVCIRGYLERLLEATK